MACLNYFDWLVCFNISDLVPEDTLDIDNIIKPVRRMPWSKGAYYFLWIIELCFEHRRNRRGERAGKRTRVRIYTTIDSTSSISSLGLNFDTLNSGEYSSQGRRVIPFSQDRRQGYINLQVRTRSARIANRDIELEQNSIYEPCIWCNWRRSLEWNPGIRSLVKFVRR